VIRHGTQVQDAVTDHLGPGFVCLGQDDGKFVAAPAGCDVFMADRLADDTGDGLEQAITLQMAKDIIADLEAVAIAEG
jgi:hypothetical protein